MMAAMTSMASRPSRTMMPKAPRKVSSLGSAGFVSSTASSAFSPAAAVAAALASASWSSMRFASFRTVFLALSVVVRYLFFWYFSAALATRLRRFVNWASMFCRSDWDRSV